MSNCACQKRTGVGDLTPEQQTAASGGIGFVGGLLIGGVGGVLAGMFLYHVLEEHAYRERTGYSSVGYRVRERRRRT
jgi:hypothetical protein